MSDSVWMCFSLKKLELWAELTNEWRDENIASERMISLSKGNEAGDAIARDAFPPEIYGDLPAREADYNFTDFFVANGLPVISGRLANVLRRFDLGDASLYPVPVLKKDKKTPVEGDWHFLNFGNAKHAFIPEQSSGIGFEQIEDMDCWIMGHFGKPDEIVVSGDALSGPDIWVEPRCASVFFMSDRLVSELKAEKLTGLDLVKCKVA